MISSRVQSEVSEGKPPESAAQLRGAPVPDADSVYLGLRLPYRPSEAEPISVLPGDRDAGLASAVVECRKGLLPNNEGAYSLTTLNENSKSDRLCLTLLYKEPFKAPASLEAQLAVNGVRARRIIMPERPDGRKRVHFPFVVREEELDRSLEKSLKHLVEDMIQAFRSEGPAGVTRLVVSRTSNHELSLPEPTPFLGDLRLIDSLQELSERFSRQASRLPSHPTITVRGCGENEFYLGLKVEHGPALDIYLDRLSVNDHPSDDQYLIREFQISRGGDGFLAALGIFGREERYRISGCGWCVLSAGTNPERTVLGRMIHQYHQLIADDSGAEKKPLASYLEPLGEYDLQPMNLYTRITGAVTRARSNRQVVANPTL